MEGRLFLNDVNEKSVGLEMDPFIKVVVWRIEEMHIPPRNPKINDTAPYVVQNDFDGLDCFIAMEWK